MNLSNTLTAAGRPLQLDDHGNLVAGLRLSSDPRGAILSDAGGGQHVLQGASSFDDPTVSNTDHVIVFEKSTITASGALAGAQLEFASLSLANPIELPAIVNGPAAPCDGVLRRRRYLAYVSPKDGEDELRIWDTQTHAVVQGTGLFLGPHDDSSDRRQLLRFDGAIALHRDPIILFTGISLSGVSSFWISLQKSLGADSVRSALRADADQHRASGSRTRHLRSSCGTSPGRARARADGC